MKHLGITLTDSGKDGMARWSARIAMPYGSKTFHAATETELRAILDKATKAESPQ